MADAWQTVSVLPDLQPGELQIWRINLAAATKFPDISKSHLAPEEIGRASRLRAGQVRLQFLVARTCLRVLLGNILNLNPREVPVFQNAFGKPETPTVDGYPLHFNLAHSRETILIALCRESPVGIDLEYLDRETEVLEVARNFFHPEEFHQIAAIADPELRRRAFFRCWTRKEAVIKADGRGLSLPLTAFRVPVIGAANAAQVVISDDVDFTHPSEANAAVPAQYFVSDLALGDDSAAAFAVTTPQVRPGKLVFPFVAL